MHTYWSICIRTHTFESLLTGKQSFVQLKLAICNEFVRILTVIAAKLYYCSCLVIVKCTKRVSKSEIKLFRSKKSRISFLNSQVCCKVWEGARLKCVQEVKLTLVCRSTVTALQVIDMY